MARQRGGPPLKAAGGRSVAAQTAEPTRSNHSTEYRREDGYAAPTPEDGAVADAIEVLRAYGYGIACRCLDCNRPITAAVSLARMRGRRCAERAEVVK